MPGWVIAMFVIGGALILRNMAKTVFEAARSRREAAVYDNHPQKIQMEQYADTFRTLADSFYQMPQRQELLTGEQVDRMVEVQREEICGDCPKADWCWQQNPHLTREQCGVLLAAFSQGDERERTAAWSDWMLHCLNGTRFLELFWNQYQRARQNLLWCNRILENRLAVADQLSEMAGILSRAARNAYSLCSIPDELSGKIRRQMKREGADVLQLWMQELPGERLQLFLTMKAGRGCRMTLRQAAGILSGLCGSRMVAERDAAQVLTGEYQTILFREDEKYQALYGVGRITKDAESVSGDSYSVLCENGQLVLCLSDGMGSGVEACRESELVVELLEQFLRSGFSRETAVRMINSALMLQRDGEIFSTVDVSSIDLYSGVCSFLKAGAAPSFLLRDSWVEVIGSTSLPVGLSEKLDYDTAAKKLYDGDYLIMITDGVLDAMPAGDEEAVRKLLLEIPVREPREFAREFLERVLRAGEYRARDDMTVLVTRLWKK